MSSARKFLVRGIKNAKYGKFVDTLKTKESDWVLELEHVILLTFNLLLKIIFVISIRIGY